MKVNPIAQNAYIFGNTQNLQKNNTKQNDENPISKSGEKAKLLKATFFGGLVLGAKLLFELCDDGFVFDDLSKGAEKFVDKHHKEASKNRKAFLYLGVFAGFLIMAVSGFAMLYTLFKAPKINYEGNVNAFKKGKDMDVYIKGNNVEKELYTQMNEKAKTGNPEEKEKLKTQYMQMQTAKNRVPDFVKQL